MDEKLRFIARLLACDGNENTKELHAFRVFEQVFKEYGLPGTIRTDNGLPFSSPNTLFGLSKLSVWWLRLGIGRRKINVSSVFAGQKVGIREVNDKIWLVSFMKYDIGFFDEHENKNRTGCTKPV